MIFVWIAKAGLYIGKLIIENYISEKIKQKFEKAKHKFKNKSK